MQTKKKKNNTENIILKNKKILALLIFLIFILVIFLVNYYPNDGMEQAGIRKISYRIYTSEFGWSKWKKNGLTCGDLKNNIKNLQVKLDSDDNIIYSYYTSEKDWSDTSNGVNHNKKDDNNINAIKLATFYDISSRYDLCYRTYNKKDGWLEWTCRLDGISGNANEPIKGIEIKLIPKNVVKTEYLKDYNLNKNNENKGF